MCTLCASHKLFLIKVLLSAILHSLYNGPGELCIKYSRVHISRMQPINARSYEPPWCFSLRKNKKQRAWGIKWHEEKSGMFSSNHEVRVLKMAPSRHF
jgi:hypothetical protein